MNLRVVYFAWVRERIGVPTEEIETNAATIGELIEELKAREERYALAFSDLNVVRAALNQALSPLDTPLFDGAEVAFFPPMTGG